MISIIVWCKPIPASLMVHPLRTAWYIQERTLPIRL